MLITLYYVNYYELLQAVLYISKKGLSKCPTLTSICAPDNSRFYRMLSLTFKTKHMTSIYHYRVWPWQKKNVLVYCYGKLINKKNRMAEAHFVYLVIFGKPGSVLAKVSTLQCTCWWVRSTQTASKTWLDAQTPRLSSAMRQILNLEDDSSRFVCSVHIRPGSWIKMVSLQAKGEVDYVIWQG